MRNLKFFEAIREATAISLRDDPSVYLVGLGVPDPKGIFGTTEGLQSEYGADRVFDMPISENAMTGISIGASIDGIKSVVVHQRLDFFAHILLPETNIFSLPASKTFQRYLK